MAKRGGTFKSEKRKKELGRQKKKEEKMQRRLNKAGRDSQNPEATEAAETTEAAAPQE